MGYRASDATASRGTEGRRLWWYHAICLLAVVGYLAAGIAGLTTLLERWREARFQQRGVTFGLPARKPGAAVDPWGINVSLEQYRDEQALERSLDLVVEAGFRWVRQRFPWAEIEPEPGGYRWERWDRLVRQCQSRGLRIIAVIDTSPQWARRGEDATNPLAPPHDDGDLAGFTQSLAQRYGRIIDHYQIWDEPNIYPHWGERDPDPAAYASLARKARERILDADPGAQIIAAGLAPTTEMEGRNLSDLFYLRELYGAGGRELFDVIAAKPYGFWSGPEDRAVDNGILNFSRVVALREEMVRNGDSEKPLWAVAWGWSALPADWKGRPSPWGNDEPERQYERDVQAIARARAEWPWLGLLCYASWQPAADADDPIWGLALLDREGKPGPLFERFRALAREPQVLYPGSHELAVETDGGLPVEIRFWGNRLDLLGPGRWRLITLDGESVGRELATNREEPVLAVRGLELDEHRLSLRVEGPAMALGVVVSRERPALLPAWVALAASIVAVAATCLVWRMLKPYPWRIWFAAAVQLYNSLSPWVALAVGAAVLAALVGLTSFAASLAAVAVLGALIVARPDVGLAMTVFLVPLAPLNKRFGPASFSYLEIVTLLTVAAVLLRVVRDGLDRRGRLRSLADLLRWVRTSLREMDAFDAGWILLVGAALVSLLASEVLRVSLRELRVVVLQAVFVYWLLRRGRLDQAGILRLVDIVALSAVAISLQGLYQYGWTEHVIAAEGVRRIRGVYGSPNNLALVLGRVLPVMLAMVLAGPAGWRRCAYALGAVPVALCLFLTFSRGAWLLGVPAAMLALALLAGRRARLVVLGILGVGALGTLPFLGTARLLSFFSGQGTALLRLKLWEASWDMVRDHPLWGVGLDNFLYQYGRYIRPEAMSEPYLSHPHNVVLDFWLRLGLPGLLAFMWLVVCFASRALRLWRRQADGPLRAVTIGLVAAVADMLAHGLIDSAFFVVELAALFALFLGLVRCMERLRQADARPDDRPGTL